MGLFKKADEIAYLRNEIKTLNDKYLKLDKENDILREKLEAIQNFVDSTPSDCTPGKWCAACEFSSCFILPNCDYIYVCGKGRVCKNFLQREIA